MNIEELKERVEREIASLRAKANAEANAGCDWHACAHDTAADYLAKVVRWIDDVGGYRKMKCEDTVRWVNGEHVLVSEEEWHEYQGKQA